MFKFFTDKRWHLWSIGGTILILVATWYQVQLDVRINEWFGEFYDTLQKALSEPGAVYRKGIHCISFYICQNRSYLHIGCNFSDYFTSHWTFRWRTAMADFYHDKWNLLLQLKVLLREYKKILLICKNNGRFRR